MASVPDSAMPVTAHAAPEGSVKAESKPEDVAESRFATDGENSGSNQAKVVELVKGEKFDKKRKRNMGRNEWA
jgi:hypothetical protein